MVEKSVDQVQSLRCFQIQKSLTEYLFLCLEKEALQDMFETIRKEGEKGESGEEENELWIQKDVTISDQSNFYGNSRACLKKGQILSGLEVKISQNLSVKNKQQRLLDNLQNEVLVESADLQQYKTTHDYIQKKFKEWKESKKQSLGMKVNFKQVKSILYDLTIHTTRDYFQINDDDGKEIKLYGKPFYYGQAKHKDATYIFTDNEDFQVYLSNQKPEFHVGSNEIHSYHFGDPASGTFDRVIPQITYAYDEEETWPSEQEDLDDLKMDLYFIEQKDSKASNEIDTVSIDSFMSLDLDLCEYSSEPSTDSLFKQEKGYTSFESKESSNDQMERRKYEFKKKKRQK